MAFIGDYVDIILLNNRNSSELIYTNHPILYIQSYFMIKLVIGKSVKIAKLKENSIAQIRQIIKSHPNAPIDYTLTYVDADGDEVCISSDQELSQMFEIGLKNNKIFVKQSLSEIIDMTTMMTEKINPVFDRSEEEDTKEEKLHPQPLRSATEEIQKPLIGWFLNPDEPIRTKPIIQNQEKIERPVQMIGSAKDNVDQYPKGINSQNIQKKEVVPPAMTFGRIPPSPSLQSNYLIYKKKQPHHKLFIDQPLFKPIPQKEKENEKQQNFVLHQAICSNCKQDYGILGVRYLCLVCDNYNLCQECQRTVQHVHALLKIKTTEQVITKEQIADKIRKEMFSGPKPLVPNNNSAESMSKDESNHYYLETVQNYMKEGYEKSKKVFQEMITKLSGMKKNQNQFNNPSVPRPPYTKTSEEKAVNIQSVVNKDYYQILDLCKRNPSLSEQELINLYLTQRN